MRKRNHLLLAAGFCALVLFGLFGIFGAHHIEKDRMTSGKMDHMVIVIDPGHGGIDPGKVGVAGSYEKDINLSIAKYLKALLMKEKIDVIMTREKDEGLYAESDQNKKSSDMRARMELMNQTEVDLIISIHQNSFTEQSSKGAQVFYQASSENGKMLANKIQEAMVSEIDSENHRQAKANNSYYVLKKSEKPAVIVECGFLSNPQEEQLLLAKEYQKKVAKAIKKGIFAFLAENCR